PKRQPGNPRAAYTQSRGGPDRGIGVGPQARVVGVVPLEQLLARVEGHGQADVAAAAIDVGADDTGNLIFEAVGLIADAPLTVELDALEVALQDEVGDAGNRVRAVSGRGAAGDDLDSLERGRRDGRHVDRAVGIARG